MNIEAVIFDMDGVLVETEPLHCRGYVETLKQYGFELTPEMFYTHWTRKGKGIAEFVEENKIGFGVEGIREKKRKSFHSMLSPSIILDGVFEVLEKLEAIKIPKALATSSYHADADFILNFGLRKYFDVVVTGDDVSARKPDSEGFLLAASRLGINPSQCLVIEDAEKGVIAGKAAGMKVVAIPTPYTKDNDFSMADLVLGDIRQLPDLFDRLF